LGQQLADPGSDVGAEFGGVGCDVVGADVGDGGVFEVLAEGADGDAVARVAGYVEELDVGAAGLDCDAVVAALVEEVAEDDVVRV